MFCEKLRAARERNNSLLCVGLDPDPRLIPTADATSFFRAIIEATSDLVCAYKPNLPFFEAMGRVGMELLAQVMAAIPKDLPVIGDGKRNDVPHAARFYAKALFDIHGFDAAIVNPYLGMEALGPFFEYQDRGVFLLCRTSNPGAAAIQDVRLQDGRLLYEVVAEAARDWGHGDNLGLVVGATRPVALEKVRAICPSMTLLLPGIGAQGGDMESAVRAAIDEDGGGFIVSSSREVIYASRGRDFAEQARGAACRLRDSINLQRDMVLSSGRGDV